MTRSTFTTVTRSDSRPLDRVQRVDCTDRQTITIHMAGKGVDLHLELDVNLAYQLLRCLQVCVAVAGQQGPTVDEKGHDAEET